MVERGAGAGIGFGDDAYDAAGAQDRRPAEDVFAAAELIVKVKEPQPSEIARCGRARCSSPISISPPTARRPKA